MLAGFSAAFGFVGNDLKFYRKFANSQIFSQVVLCLALREKCPYLEFFDPYFPAFGLKRRGTSYLSVFSSNSRKYGPQKL